MSIYGGSPATPAGILAAQRVIQPHIWRRLLARSQALERMTGGEVYFKPVCWQPTRSFKIRGAIAIAPLLTGQVDADGLRAVAVLNGRSLESGLLPQILREHAAQ
jgi:threonine dehydratase